jgi:hypothetical protein
VIDKSGKVVSNSKHLVSVLKEAKAAYLSRRAEIKALKERDVRHNLQNLTLKDAPRSPRSRRAPSPTPSRRHGAPPGLQRAQTTRHHRSDDYRPNQPPLDRGYTDSVYANEPVYVPASHRVQHGGPDPRQVMRRSFTEPPRPSSAESYDEHLAYGEMPPPVPYRNDEDIRVKMTAVNRMLMEADCLKYTATSMIEHLQKNPDKMAAVGMALAEISSLVAKSAPGALGGLKVAFPAVMALLASPEFLIAGGLAVGVTVIMFGGYKIIKKIKDAGKASEEDEQTQMRELESELSRVDMWRRGVADASAHGSRAGSKAGSVEGELITPGAHRRAIEEGALMAHQVKPLRRAKSEHGHARRRSGPESVASYHRPRAQRAGSVAETRHNDARSEVSRRPRIYDEESRAGSHRSHTSRKSSASTKNGKDKKKSVGGIKGLLFGKKRRSSNAA